MILGIDEVTANVFGICCTVLATMCIPEVSRGVLETRAYRTRRDETRLATTTYQREQLKATAQATLRKGLGWFVGLLVVIALLTPLIAPVLVVAAGWYVWKQCRRQTMYFCPYPIVRREFTDDNNGQSRDTGEH